MSTTADLKRYAAERGIKLDSARHNRYHRKKSWLDWCSANNIDPEATGSAPKARPNKPPEPPQKTTHKKNSKKTSKKQQKTTTKKPTATNERYKAVEDHAYAQLVQVQAMLDDSLSEHDIGGVRLLTQTVNDAIRAYETAVKSRISHDMLEGRFIPASIIDNYKSTFYPAISQAVENLRSQLLFAVPEEQRAMVATAWDMAYPVYVDGVTEAEQALNGLAQGAAEAATAELKKTRNNLTKG